MIDAIAIETNLGQEPGQTTQTTRQSLQAQLGILKEVASSLLQQLDLLKTGNTRQQTPGGRNLNDEVRDFEINLITSALARTHGHQRKAARLLGLKVTTLNAKIKRYKIVSRFYLPIGEIPGKS